MNVAPAGEPLLRAAALLVPGVEETRCSLLHIRRKFKISRSQLAVIIGVAKDTLRRWEDGTRTPCTSARRLIQLVQGLFFSDEAQIMGFGAVLIGRIDLTALERTKRELLPASTRDLVARFEQLQTSAEKLRGIEQPLPEV